MKVFDIIWHNCLTELEEEEIEYAKQLLAQNDKSTSTDELLLLERKIKKTIIVANLSMSFL